MRMGLNIIADRLFGQQRLYSIFLIHLMNDRKMRYIYWPQIAFSHVICVVKSKGYSPYFFYTIYCVNATCGIKSKGYIVYTFYTMYCVNAICGSSRCTTFCDRVKASYYSFTRFCVITNCGMKSMDGIAFTFETTICNNAKPGKRTVRHIFKPENEPRKMWYIY